jgi:hypothetical protein
MNQRFNPPEGRRTGPLMDNRLPLELQSGFKAGITWNPGELITEAQAYEEYGAVLEDKQPRLVRQSGRIGFLRRKRTIFYRRDELAESVRQMLKHGYVGQSERGDNQLAGEQPRAERASKPARRAYRPQFPLGSPLEQIAARRREGLL